MTNEQRRDNAAKLEARARDMRAAARRLDLRAAQLLADAQLPEGLGNWARLQLRAAPEERDARREATRRRVAAWRARARKQIQE